MDLPPLPPLPKNPNQTLAKHIEYPNLPRYSEIKTNHVLSNSHSIFNYNFISFSYSALIFAYIPHIPLSPNIHSKLSASNLLTIMLYFDF